MPPGAPRWFCRDRGGHCDPGDGAASTRATPTPGPGRVAAQRPAARAACRLRIDDAWMAVSRDRRIRVVGVGAYVACSRPVPSVWLEVTLWKRGLLYDHRQAQRAVRTADAARAASATARVTCKDGTVSAFYGVAHAIVRSGGIRGSAWVKSSRTVPRPCGT